MGLYIANSTNSQNFNLNQDGQHVGELIYKKWYSFKAEIKKPDGSNYHLEPKGFWESKIELKERTKILLEFSMGWKGIMITTFFNNRKESYLLKLSGLLSSKFILLDTRGKELMSAQTAFKWNKLNYDYEMETTPEFDDFEQKELLLMAILHCINYYLTVIASAA